MDNNSGQIIGFFSHEFIKATNCRESRRQLSSNSNGALERILNVFGTKCMAVLKAHILSESEQERGSIVGYLPLLAKSRNQISFQVGGQQRLENVSEYLLFFNQLHVDRFDYADRRGKRHNQLASPGNLFLYLGFPNASGESAGLFQVFVRSLIFATQVRKSCCQ